MPTYKKTIDHPKIGPLFNGGLGKLEKLFLVSTGCAEECKYIEEYVEMWKETFL